ncbi:MAG: hypothetical protein IJ523_10270 [Succinivibrionaceae bacterium]|nr:hypothetical protein [Succinivibrionaceae bacterium]
MDKKGRPIAEKAGELHILHIRIPVSPTVARHKGRIFDRNGDADIDITDIADMVYQCYSRKQSTYFVNKVYPHWSVSDLRGDLIARARRMTAAIRRRENRNEHHLWDS